MVCYGKGSARHFEKAGSREAVFLSAVQTPWKTYLVGCGRGGRGGGGLWGLGVGGGQTGGVFEHERHPVGGTLGGRWWIISSFQMCSERP